MRAAATPRPYVSVSVVSVDLSVALVIAFHLLSLWVSVGLRKGLELLLRGLRMVCAWHMHMHMQRHMQRHMSMSMCMRMRMRMCM